MKPALRENANNSPSHWQAFPQGKWLAKQIERQNNKWWPRVFGYHLLKIGQLSSHIDTSTCSIKHQVNLAEHGDNIGVITDTHHLPIAENSVDAVLMAHTLDYSDDPHQLLREAHRVLIPDGYLIITGFNPLSLCGLMRFWPGLSHKLPWSARFFAPARVKDWLALLGCEVVADERFIQRSFLSSKPWFKGRKLATFSHRYLEHYGAVYMIVARKRELPLTPIKPTWKVKPKLQTVKVGSIRMRKSNR